MLLGAHTSTTGGMARALVRGADIGCECIQVFVKNNMQWFAKPYQPDELSAWASEMASGKVKVAFGHAGYLINLAAPEGENREKSLKSLKMELDMAGSLGLPFLVIHPGSHLKAGEEQGIRQIVSGLDTVFAQTDSPTRVALEVTAGQGCCLGNKIEHIAMIYEKAQHPERLGLCLDTAHLFEAGYDIRTPEGWNAVLRRVEELFGLQNLLGMHINDSKSDFGSRVDRHEHIGKGKIGVEAFRTIVNDERLTHIPGALETPKSKDFHEDRENLALLRSL